MPREDAYLEKLYSQMPRRYRLVTKLLIRLPDPTIPFFILKKFSMFEGIFYGILLPVFVFMSGVATLWLYPVATAKFGFPLNIVIVLLLPITVFAIAARVELQRAINFWEAINEPSRKLEGSKSIDKLIELFKKQQSNKSKDK